MIDKIFGILFQLLSTPVFAKPGTGTPTIPNPLPPTGTVTNSDNPPQLPELVGSIDKLFDMILPIGALIAVAMIIYGGYMWIISGGDPGRKQMAQGTLTWSVIGLVFLFLIKAILTLITEFVVS
ncbi:MAG: hypothetical protein UR84_C0001G0017 [candidate division WS6 bacterium GW2011_GWD1_35_594]|nr:MAG: hypothetical protein UR36_C0003G0052 [candidate division WS6 bacterium GW2011_GWF1_33_233]KKP55107.1 MAG: hypothetical protein UR45_C0004G0002 [candidate division WS6 bacterium GW2011_WS6_33_547]KKP56275.1 MAG: hypothetical protein UR49_C0016G0006 [candidate division WS6 bacterium GW2011_GWF2_33_92]KKP82612.1 MAG: hypothetical protein UR84_C0001G0017 [candidate division WS6 bacterium GW2011_GWD1_35_594]